MRTHSLPVGKLLILLFGLQQHCMVPACLSAKRWVALCMLYVWIQVYCCTGPCQHQLDPKSIACASPQSPLRLLQQCAALLFLSAAARVMLPECCCTNWLPCLPLQPSSFVGAAVAAVVLVHLCSNCICHGAALQW